MENNIIKGYEENKLLKEISGVPELLRNQFITMEADLRQFLTVEEIFDTTDIYITGCGDSHMAAICASMAFSELTGLRIWPMTALHQSYYSYVHSPEKRNLVIGLSNSGETSRVIEAVQKMSIAGCRTMALTCNENSRLAKASNKVFRLDVPKWTNDPIPGVRSFVVPLMALYLLAVRMGEVRGVITMDEAQELRKELIKIADTLEMVFSEGIDSYMEFSKLCMENRYVEIIGAGSCLGAAQFGAAKIIEGLGIRASAIELEEFAHVEYFETRPGQIPVILLGGKKMKPQIRNDEVNAILKSIERPVLSIESDKVDEKWRPLVFSVMLAMVAACMSQLSDEPYFRGFTGVWESGRCVGVKDSKLSITEEPEEEAGGFR